MPSVSVVYKNNPNYRVVYLDPDLRAVTDYEQWYMNLIIATGMIILKFRRGKTTVRQRAGVI